MIRTARLGSIGKRERDKGVTREARDLAVLPSLRDTRVSSCSFSVAYNLYLAGLHLAGNHSVRI